MIEAYQREISQVLERLWSTQTANLRRAATKMADSIAAGGFVHLYGSGHSVIPVLDMFPRYGSFAGLHPMMDSRLMWFSVLDAGGVRELLWLERTEGYAPVFLETQDLDPVDTVVVFSHGGMNAAPIEVALECRRRGLTVVAVTSMDNQRRKSATHSSGKKLSDACDIVIDNCVSAEDALVQVEGMKGRVAAGSTVAAVTVGMALVAELAQQLHARGLTPRQFVSPNVEGVPADNNLQVFADYHRRRTKRAASKS
jgi:uncharacterized phosphosugar-binding protein